MIPDETPVVVSTINPAIAIWRSGNVYRALLYPFFDSKHRPIVIPGSLNRSADYAFKFALRWLEIEDAVTRRELQARGWGPRAIPNLESESLYAGMPEDDFSEEPIDNPVDELVQLLTKIADGNATEFRDGDDIFDA